MALCLSRKKRVEYSNAVLVEELVIEGWTAPFFWWPEDFFRRLVRFRYFPQLAVAEYFFDHRRVLDERYYLHRAPAFRAFERIDLVYCLYECRPGNSALFAKGCIRLRHYGNLLDTGLLSLDKLGTSLFLKASTLIRIKTIVPYLVFPFIGNMLRDLSQKVQRIEHFKIPWYSGQK